MSSNNSDPGHRFARNIVSNWAHSLVAAGIAFFLSPFLVHTLGPERYGVWALVFSIISYMNLLDLGMKQTLARFLSKHYATGDWHGLSEVVSTSTAIYAVTGGLVILATLGVAHFFLSVFKVAPDLLPTMRVTLTLIGINQAVTFFLMSLTAIGPFHRYDLSNAIEIPFAILQAAAVVSVLALGYGLVTLAGTVLLVNVLRLVVRYVAQQRLVPQINLRLALVKRGRVRELLSYGVISLFIVLSWIVLLNIQNIIIGVFVAATSVTYYNLAGQLLFYLRGIINAIGTPMVPLVSHLVAVRERHKIARTHLRVTGYLYYLTTTACIGILFFGREFIFLWMGPGFDVTATILTILTIPACLYLPQVIANSVLLGLSRHKALFYVLLAEVTLVLALSIIFVGSMGPVGVAWGTAISQVLVYSFAYPCVFQRIIGDKLLGFYRVCGMMVARAALYALPTALAMRCLNHIGGWPGFFLSVAVIIAVSGFGFWFKVLDRLARENISGSLRKMGRNRLPPSQHA